MLENVTDLNLSNNKIKHIPPQIASLTKLRKLDLRNNELVEIPSQILAILTNLETLSLSGNTNLKIPKDYNITSLINYLNIKDKVVPKKTTTICVLTEKYEDFTYFSEVLLENVSEDINLKAEIEPLETQETTSFTRRRFLSLEAKKSISSTIFEDIESEENSLSQEHIQEFTIDQINLQKVKRGKEKREFKDKWYRETEIPEYDLKLKIQVIFFY